MLIERARAGQRRSLVFAAFTASTVCAAGCQEGGPSSGGPRVTPNGPDYSGTNIPVQCQTPIFGSGFVSTTISGPSTIIGPQTLCGTAFADADKSFFAVLGADVGGGRLTLQVTVPERQMTGAGTYACGHETNVAPQDSIYCDIQAKHVPSQGDQLSWLLSLDAQPGTRSDCWIRLDTLPSEGAKGGLSCGGILDSAYLTGSTHPDAGTPLSLSGNFEFMPVFQM